MWSMASLRASDFEIVPALATRSGIAGLEDLALDTYVDEARFFSYRRATHRREADYGRLVAAIALV